MVLTEFSEKKTFAHWSGYNLFSGCERSHMDGWEDGPAPDTVVDGNGPMMYFKSIYSIYPLVNLQKTMEKTQCLMGKSQV